LAVVKHIKKSGRKSGSAALANGRRVIGRRHHAVACMLSFFVFSFLAASLLAEAFTSPAVHKEHGPINFEFFWFIISGAVIGLVFGYILHRYLYLVAAERPNAPVKPGRIARAGMRLGRPLWVMGVILVIGFFLGKELLRDNWMQWRMCRWTPGISASTPEKIVLWRLSKMSGTDAERFADRLSDRLIDHPVLKVRRNMFYLLDAAGVRDEAVVEKMKKVVLTEYDDHLREKALRFVYHATPYDRHDENFFLEVVLREKSPAILTTAAMFFCEVCREETLIKLLNDPARPRSLSFYNGLQAGLERRLKDIDPKLVARLERQKTADTKK
jgi:hypothetical protein